MALADFQQERREVKHKGEVIFTVRGLNLQDATTLITSNLDEIEKTFLLYEQSKKQIFSSRSLDKFILATMNAFPGLAAEVISVAADEPGTQAQAAKLPFAVQVFAISEIAKLTLEEVGGLKNLFESAIQTARENLSPAALAVVSSRFSEAPPSEPTGDSEGT